MKNLLQPSNTKRILFFLLSDLLLSLFSLYSAYLLRFNFDIPSQFLESFWLVFLILAALKVSLMVYWHVYYVAWRFFGFNESKNIIKAHLLAYALFTLIYLLFSDAFAPFPRSVILIDLFLSMFLIGMLRIAKRLIIEQNHNVALKQTLILGVNPRTASIIKSARDGDIPYYPVAIAVLRDENRSAVNTYIHDVKVFSREKIRELIEEKNIQAAIVTTELGKSELGELFEMLTSAGVHDIKQIKLLGDRHEKLQDLSIEDLLARRPKDLDTEAIGSFVKGKRVLITGAGGSIGSEIALQCQRFGARELILVDNSEYSLYAIGEKLPQALLKLVSVTERTALQKIFEENEAIDIVIHAAAYKHVPICEANIAAAVNNNVLGTKNVIDTAIENDVGKMVIISTDKAVRPTNVMGTTKRITELYGLNVERRNTEIVAVRFGNVLGSSGSVIPKFKSQIEEGGPVTVTHPEITRYFMMIPEACQLVLQAAAIAKGGELFILDMGKPVNITDLARQMIRLYGKEDEIEIVFTGLRPGEKMYEELLIDEQEQKTKYSSIYIARSTPYPIEKLTQDIAELFESEKKLEVLKRIVPEFEHKP